MNTKMKKPKRDKTELLLYEPNLYKAFLILALPVMGANLLKSFHDLVDTYFIGQMENSVSAQAAISIAWPLINILTALSIGLTVAGTAIISQLLGAGRKEDGRRYAAILLSFSVLLGIFINLLLFLIAPPVMRLMGAEGEVLDCAVIYLRIRAFEMIFVFIFSSFQAIRQSQGDTVTPVILSMAAVGTNIVLTAVFIRICRMGIAGAALATVIGQIVITPICLKILFSKKELLPIERKDFNFERESACKLVKIALPSAASQALSSLGFLVLQAFILDFGAEVAASFSIGNKISNLLLIPVSALGSVLAAYVGQNIGAGNKERARKSYQVSRNLGIGVAVTGILIIYPFREFLLGLLTNDATTLSYAMEYIFWVLLTQPFMSVFQNYIGVFNGSGNTKFSFAIVTARLWIVRLPLIMAFKNFTDLGRSGIWYAMCISNVIILIIGHALFKHVNFENKV